MYVNHFNQSIAIYIKKQSPYGKVFPSSLGPTMMRWFFGLDEGLMRLYEELTRLFEARFMTCSRVPKHIDSFLTMKMGEGESLRAYSDWYW